MATRAIVTSHPVVACDVCGRRLLRGENPDVFLAGGQRRTVCELCVPRAASEGWMREADNHASSVRPTRTRRAGSLFGRLRQLREPGERSPRRESGNTAGFAGETESPGSSSYDFLDRSPAEQDGASARELYISSVEAEESYADTWDAEPGHSVGDMSLPQDLEPSQSTPVRAVQTARAVTSGELKVARALEVFNAGEQPRRVAGVARSLGAPSITVRPLEESGGTVAIVVAWELCWYRYEVDLGDEAAGPQLVAQGMELDELPEEDRLANAVADDRGELASLLA